jgi:hypothetical protein
LTPDATLKRPPTPPDSLFQDTCVV